MTRVWLTPWEWECCGTPFVIGDEVSFAASEVIDPWLTRMLGADLAATIDAVESHHEDPGPDRVAGRVADIRAVSIEMRNRRVRRSPRTPSPMSSTLTLASDDPDGSPLAWRVGAPTDWYVEGMQVPGTAVVAAAERVPGRAPDAPTDRRERVDAAVGGEGPVEWSERSLAGWIVTVDADRPKRD